MKIIPRLFREFTEKRIENKVIVAIHHDADLYLIKHSAFAHGAVKRWRETPHHAGLRLLREHFTDLVSERDIIAGRVPCLGYQRFYAVWLVAREWPLELFNTELRKQGMLLRAAELVVHERRQQATITYLGRKIREHDAARQVAA